MLLRGGSVLGPDGAFERADVLIEGDRITDVGPDLAPGSEVIDCGSRVILPGLIDAHSHADAAVFDPAVQLALLRQGVTTIVGGQDGVSFAPGDGAYASRYFASINGEHPNYRGGGVGALLAGYDGAIPLNAAYLAPAGTIRHEVMGSSAVPATPDQLATMRSLLRGALEEGAVGLSTGLDYAPGIFADAAELAALCEEVAAVDGLYATHMRGGYEANAAVGFAEIAEIVRLSGVRAHVSHLHGPIPLLLDLLDGSGLSFDAYPYSRGCTLLAMLVLPPEWATPGSRALADALVSEGRDAVVATIRTRVLARPDLGTDWAGQITFSHLGAPRLGSYAGRTVAEVASAFEDDPAELVLDVLLECDLQVSAIMRVPSPRTLQQLAELFRHPGHTGGSDGIFVGSHPHPRAFGTFARYLAEYVGGGLLDWTTAVSHLSTSPARLFRLGDRGSVRRGAIADLVVTDVAALAARSTYADPTLVASGIDDVLVAGRPVLRGGELTGELAGRGIRRAPHQGEG